MAKKTIAPAPKKPDSAPNKQLVDAIITVKSLQEFIQQHGCVDRALDAVGGVRRLVELTGGFDALTEALKIVGGQSSAGDPCGESAAE